MSSLLLMQLASPSSETATQKLGSLVQKIDGRFIEKDTPSRFFNFNSDWIWFLADWELEGHDLQQPWPAGQGHAVELAQLHLAVPVVADGAGQTQ